MLSLDDARARLLARATRLSVERVGVAQSSGRVLAADLRASEALPPFDHSAMDGYAVASLDFHGAGPWTFPVSAGGGAGTTAPEMRPRTAQRIFTGAPLPAGADSVVKQEDAQRQGEDVLLATRPRLGQHVRHAGEDLPVGALALSAGTRMHAGAIALAAMLGRAEVIVTRQPRVTILCSGDELRIPGEVARPASIFESNSAALGALARQAGASVRVAPIVRDDRLATEQAVREALEGTDVLLTVGGVSVGDHDVMRPALESAGVTLDFWKVAVKPGKPLAVGHRDAVHVLGLPGNPASALVAFAFFGAPLLRALQGDANPAARPIAARLLDERKRLSDRVELVRATLRSEAGSMIAEPLENQSSAAATSLAASDGLAVIPPGSAPLQPGTGVAFVRWVDL
jgi:molybdopterin molybdotransferase